MLPFLPPFIDTMSWPTYLALPCSSPVALALALAHAALHRVLPYLHCFALLPKEHQICATKTTFTFYQHINTSAT